MSQAQILSRRALIAGASTIAAATVVPATEAKSTGPAEIGSGAEPILSHPDAELLAIGERLTPLYEAWCKQMAADHLERFELEIAIATVTGFKLDAKWSDAYWSARREALETIPDKRSRSEEDARSRELNTLMDALTDVAADILTFNPDTREGLGLQVRAIVFHHSELIEPSLDHDGESEDGWLRCFLESVCVFAGVPFPPYRTYVDRLREREG